MISLAPLVGAIAAGCVAVIKPSEHAPAVAKALADLFPKYLDPNAYTVLVGAIAETTHILELRWDYIFFTGGEGVGKIIAAAAAKHVTPHTLELGGQNPAVIDDDVDLALAAKRILWGLVTGLFAPESKVLILHSGKNSLAVRYVLPQTTF